MKNSLLCVVFLMLISSPMTQAYERIPLSPEFLARTQRAALLDQAGKAAAGAHDYADAILDFRAAVKWEPIPLSYLPDLASALDQAGKKDEAFQTYRQAFGTPIGSLLGGFPDQTEAIAHFGIMCEDRGLHQDAVQCFNAAEARGTSLGVIGPLDTWAAKTTSPSLMRALLMMIEGCALESEGNFGRNRIAGALAAYRAAVKLAPNDPRPQFCLGNGLAHAGRLTEAEAAWKKAAVLDKRGDLKFAVKQRLESIHHR